MQHSSDDPFLQKQALIDRELADALIVATPEYWQSVTMLVEREDDGAQEKMNILISSPDGNPEPISPTDEIYEGLYRLSDLFRARGKMWTSVSYRVSQLPDGNWDYKVQFTY
jgi:hypothetical protein